MSSVMEIAWSDRIDECDWVNERLVGSVILTVASIVPSGFEAYARVLHPARVVKGETERNARWSEVASWSDTELQPKAQFHSVALPPASPDAADLSVCRPPRRGSLTAEDCASLVSLLRSHTTTVEKCWFCVWEGYAWQGRASDPIPADVLNGPKVVVSRRDYVLYGGPIEAAAAIDDADSHSPNLWWPADQSWCVASDIDLPWTYVGGSSKLIEELLAREDLEVLPAGPADTVWRIEKWIVQWVATGVEELLRTGNCRIETSRGVIDAWFERPGLEPGTLGITSETDDGRRWGKRTRIEHRVEVELRRLLSLHLMMHLVDLVET
jgi:hypothetical protein